MEVATVRRTPARCSATIVPHALSVLAERRNSPGQIRTAVARSPLDRIGSIQSLESLARDRVAVTIGR